MTTQYRLCQSSYRSGPQAAEVHSQLFFHISSPSTTDNEGGGWIATGPIGVNASGATLSNFFEENRTQTRAVNRCLVADQYIYTLVGDTLFRVNFTSPPDVGSHDGWVANNWSGVYTLTNVTAGRVGKNTGIYSPVIKVGTTGNFTRYVVGAWNAAGAGANIWRGFRHNPVTNITEVTPNFDLGFAATPAQGAVKAEILWNNKLYFIADTDGGVGTFDPQSMTLYRYGWGTTDIWGPHDFCPYKGRLYCLNRGEHGAGGSSGIFLWDITEGKPRLALNFGTSGIGIPTHASEQFDGRCVLFTDREFLYAGLVSTFDSSTFAYRFHKLLGDSSGVFTYRGRNPNVLDSVSTGRVNFFTEQNTYPDMAGDGNSYSPTGGQQITINYDKVGATGDLRVQWSWNGPDGLVAVDESLNSSLFLHASRETARSHCKNGGGERIWTPTSSNGDGGPRVDITSIGVGTAAGRTKIEYKIINNYFDFPAGSPATIQLRWDSNGHMPYNRGSLAVPNFGTLSENNTVISLPVTSSGITYSFEWDYISNGLNSGQNTNIALLISTTGVVV